MRNKEYPIDFVITWVDGNDPKWQKEYYKYKGEDGDKRAVRFRDMDTLQYWFRGVEKFAPWVNKVYFVTCGQQPEWLNINHPKLVRMHHEQFIPPQYLPTFSSHAIEMNLHRIPGLSEHFVYFNDDMFLVGNTEPNDFFVDGLPCDSAVINYAAPREEPLNLVPFVNIAAINRNFIKKEVMKQQAQKFFTLKYHKYLLKNIQFIMGKWFPGFKYFHLPSSFLKSTFDEVWQREHELLDRTCSHKFRVLTDANQWLCQNWQICKGDFFPRDTNMGFYGSIDSLEKLEETVKHITDGKCKFLCANDSEFRDLELIKSKLNGPLQKLFPKKSSFEI